MTMQAERSAGTGLAIQAAIPMPNPLLVSSTRGTHNLALSASVDPLAGVIDAGVVSLSLPSADFSAALGVVLARHARVIDISRVQRDLTKRTTRGPTEFGPGIELARSHSTLVKGFPFAAGWLEPARVRAGSGASARLLPQLRSPAGRT